MKHNPTALRRPRRGFTLLEMVIVLGIIAMIMGGAIFAMRNAWNTAKPQQAKADFNSMLSALELYRLNAGHYPSTQQGLNALVNKPSGTPVPKVWRQAMSKIPNDPWGNPYVYRFPGKKNASQPEIISKGDDGVENTGDDLSSQDD